MNQLSELNTQFKKKIINKEKYIKKMHDIHKLLWNYHGYIQDKNIESIEISRKNIAITTREGVKMICDPEDERVIPIEILNFGDYETDEIKMMRRFLKKDSVIVDIGANIGWYSINLSKDIPQGQIIAFEPIPKTFDYLKRNIALNGIKNTRIFNFGLSEKEETLAFYYDPKLSGATSLRNLQEHSKKIKIKCEVKRMDDFILNIVSKIDLIKCDVEGAEIFVIRGAIETLKKTQPILFLEMLRKWSAKFGYHPNEIIDLLNNIGYKCYFVENEKLIGVIRIDDETKATNFYFLNSSKHIKYLKELS